MDECPKDARMLYINYPNNPTGATCDLDYLKKVYDWCQENGTILCYDAAYSEMCYDGYQAPSILQVGPDAIEFGSFSKTFNMTGFRLGYAVGHPDLIAGLTKCKGQTDSGAPIFIQKAGIKALEMYGDDGKAPKAIADNMAIYAERRKVLVEGLRKLGYDVVMPGVHPEDDRHRCDRHPRIWIRRERRRIHQNDRHRARRAHQDRAREDGARLLPVTLNAAPLRGGPFLIFVIDTVHARSRASGTCLT